MSRVEEHLDRWLAGRVVDPQTADRIRTFESKRAPEAPRGGPLVIEVVTYLGLAIVAVGVAILIGQSWDELGNWGRALSLGIPASGAALAGAFLLATRNPPFVRGGQVAWLVSTGLFAALAGTLADIAGWEDEDAILAAGVTALLVSALAWWASRSHVQVVGMSAASFLFSISVGNQFGDGSAATVIGSILAGLGLAGVALAELDLLTPRLSARALAAIMLGFGGFMAGVEGGPQEVVAFAAGALLLTLSVTRGVFVYAAAGVITTFGALIVTVTEHISNTTGVAVALMAIGLLLVATVVLLARFRPWTSSHWPQGSARA